jgi:hypothetical protein
MLDGSTVLSYFTVGDVEGIFGYHMDNGAHTAMWLNVPAGTHQVYVEYQRSMYANECLSGWNSSGSFLSVEEIP